MKTRVSPACTDTLLFSVEPDGQLHGLITRRSTGSRRFSTEEHTVVKANDMVPIFTCNLSNSTTGLFFVS